jgi:putative transposase
MANHVHDLTTPPSVEMASKCVARFAQRYAQLRNAQRGGSGKLFEQRFYSKPVADDGYLLRATIYIDANPVRAGLVTDPLDYPWSTYALHAGVARRSGIPVSLWTPSPWYLSLGATRSKRAERYRELFDAHVATIDFPELAYLDEPYTRRLLRPNGSRAAESTFWSRTPLISDD